MSGDYDISIEDLRDPCPDIRELFVYYNGLYFEDRLGACVVEWSSDRMTSCAGTCSSSSMGGCIIRISKPLMKWRSVTDLKNTLLHEMIHAFIHLTRIRDTGAHGREFQRIMDFINKARFPDAERPSCGYHITIYHKFHDEVQFYQQHWWKCSKCGDEVKRAVNRKPQPADCTRLMVYQGICHDPRCKWHRHQDVCGGPYVKTHEPEKIRRPSSRGRTSSKASQPTTCTLDKWVSSSRNSLGEPRQEKRRITHLDSYSSLTSPVGQQEMDEDIIDLT